MDGGPDSSRREGLVDRDPLVRRLFAAARALIRVGYFTFEVEGVNFLPREGPVVYAQNHSGWFPLDAFFLTFAIAEAQGLARAPYFATVDAALETPGLRALLSRFGALPASSFRRPERLPPEVQSVGIFPEGVRGNCKPFWYAYQLRDFNRGFVRVAVTRRAPIVPTAILGGEECVPVAWTVRFLAPLIGSILPLPLSLVPLPAHWRIIFHEPIRLDAPKEAVTDHAYCSRVARRVQEIVQGTLDREVASRPVGRFAAMLAGPKPTPGAPLADPEDPLAEPEPTPLEPLDGKASTAPGPDGAVLDGLALGRVRRN
jgi:1-acyl-sn-glycerol-3-phosphate acyltransferase